ncbi:DUF4192 domain-containing protein [Nocardia carnea]|uniref:DUF4192 domain-containing protein n=1 Tax=Nocardia carnea TaxID=37328 RepID=UPI002455B454|nr:DUF4192 domain-containing protein [Nocardia carnea]
MTPAAASAFPPPTTPTGVSVPPGPDGTGRSPTTPARSARCPTARVFSARPVAAPAPAALRGTAHTESGGRSSGRGRLRCGEGAAGEYDWLARPHPARLDDPGDLLAAIPAMLGFCPERSLILAVLCAGTEAPHSAVVDLVVRFDLLRPVDRRPPDTTTVAAAAARVCARPGVVGVLAVLVDDDLVEPENALAEPVPVLAELERRLAAAAVPVRAAWAAPVIRAGHPWWSLTDPRERGLIADPAASRVTLNRVLDGRPVRRSRDELTALVAADTASHARVSAELTAAKARAKDRYAAAARRGDPIGFLRGELATVLWLIASAESGSELDARELADLAVALRDRELRDSMFALAAGPHAAAAEQLWLWLTRALHGPDRAESATLLGYFAYVRGDGPFAGIALDAALSADPHHSMANLLHTALEAGMRPERLRELARCGRDCAAALGVDLDAGRW